MLTNCHRRLTGDDAFSKQQLLCVWCCMDTMSGLHLVFAWVLFPLMRSNTMRQDKWICLCVNWFHLLHVQNVHQFPPRLAQRLRTGSAFFLMWAHETTNHKQKCYWNHYSSHYLNCDLCCTNIKWLRKKKKKKRSLGKISNFEYFTVLIKML